MKTAALILLLLVILAAATIAAGYYWFEGKLDQESAAGREELFVVPPGASIQEVARLLEEAGVIESALLFRIHMKFRQGDASVKAGEYRFIPPVTIRRTAERLIEGRVFYHRITVPEGLDWRETAAALSGHDFGGEEEYLALVSVPDLVSAFDPKAENLEGYLFPETYSVTRGTTPSEIVRLMVSRFKESWTGEFEKRAGELDMSMREIITLASLIEKETARPEERPLVSAVFHNRLRLGMKLGCDPTVIYAVKRVKPWDGIIHRSDLDLDSPYNTYLYPGLPPGPIASPGLESIRAALYPAESEFLYFVSRNDGSHIFSSTYADHSRAVDRYQR